MMRFEDPAHYAAHITQASLVEPAPFCFGAHHLRYVTYRWSDIEERDPEAQNVINLARVHDTDEGIAHDNDV